MGAFGGNHAHPKKGGVPLSKSEAFAEIARDIFDEGTFYPMVFDG